MGELIVGSNTYVTLDEANEYIRTHFTTSSNERVVWDNTSDEDKIVYLVNSAESMNGLKYKGRKKIPGQPLAFPRENFLLPGVIKMPVFTMQSSDTTLINGFNYGDGLKEAKCAQIENAIAHAVTKPTLVSESRTRMLSGISSEKSGNMSKSYNNTDNYMSKSMMIGIYNPEKIQSILKCWVTNSVYSI